LSNTRHRLFVTLGVVCQTHMCTSVPLHVRRSLHPAVKTTQMGHIPSQLIFIARWAWFCYVYSTHPPWSCSPFGCVLVSPHPSHTTRHTPKHKTCPHTCSSCCTLMVVWLLYDLVEVASIFGRVVVMTVVCLDVCFLLNI
jgi:hypothetical protein